MPDHDRQRERVKQLLAQDPNINEDQLKEFRMTLEANVANWEQRSERVRRWLIRSITVLVLGYLASIFSIMGAHGVRTVLENSWWMIMYEALYWVVAIATLLSLLAAIGLGILYFAKYAPALKRARFDVHTSMILQLQEQVAQLRADLERRGKS